MPVWAFQMCKAQSRLARHKCTSLVTRGAEKLAAYEPMLSIEVHIAASRSLTQDFDHGIFDAVIVQHEGRKTQRHDIV